jgi:uncharacterized protein (DUF2147 family)
MIAIIKRAVARAAVALASTGSVALAAPNPLGVWIDHTGRGAVEITDCGGKLCGRLVWFKDPKSAKDGCNFQIIGDVRRVGANTWDGGWIVDPEKDPDKRYDVEITALGDQKLKVMGYDGVKFLSETMIWTRAPAGLVRCGSKPKKSKEGAVSAPPWLPDEPRSAKAAAASSKVDHSFARMTFQ